MEPPTEALPPSSLTLGNVPTQVRRQRANRLVDFVDGDPSFFRRLLDAIARDGLNRIEVWSHPVKAYLENNLARRIGKSTV